MSHQDDMNTHLATITVNDENELRKVLNTGESVIVELTNEQMADMFKVIEVQGPLDRS